MAQKTVVELIDDLDETPAAETVRFGIDGRHYEIDLSEGNATRLRDAFEGYVRNARKRNGTVKTRARVTADRGQLSAIREWARRHDLPVADRGRVSDLVKLAHAKDDPSIARV